MPFVTMVAVLITSLASPPREGAFVGTFVVADTVSLVVRGNNGDQVTFVVDNKSSVPAGFVPGTAVAVRFETLPGGRYRAVSVGPAHIPGESDAVTALPTRAEPGAEPTRGPNALEIAAGPSAESVPAGKTVPPRRETATGPRAGKNPLPDSEPVTAVVPTGVPAASPPQSVASTPEATDSSSPDAHQARWLGAIAILLVATVAMAWRAFGRG